MQSRSEKTRARLLSSALKRFAVSGYGATSVEEICAEADVSKGAFYHHFESKQALFLCLLDNWLQGIDTGLAGLRKSTVPETLRAMTELMPGVLASASEQLPIFLEFWLQASRDEEVWQATIEPYQHFREYFAQIIEEGIAEGSIKQVDSRLAGQIILSMAVGVLLQGVLEPHGADWEKTAKEGMEIIMRGLIS